MLENKKTQNGIHYSRFIASWVNAGGTDWGEYFAKWLAENGCTEEDIHAIQEMRMTGKLELEVGAKQFMKANSMRAFYKELYDIDIEEES
jgi:hypothetical protein